MKKYIFFILTLKFSCLKSQYSEMDWGAWLSLGSTIKISPKNRLEILLRFRQYDNFIDLNSWYYDVGYSFRIFRNLNISFHYSFNPSKSIQNFFRNLHQYYLKILHRYRWNKYYELSQRFILQYNTHRFITDLQDNGYQPFYRTDLRYRTGIIRRLSSTSEIYLLNECMFTLSRVPIEMRRNRTYAGYKFITGNNYEISLYYVLQIFLHRNKSPELYQNILGFDFIYIFR